MERFPTWQVWKLIHTYPVRDVHLLLRMLGVVPFNASFSLMQNAWIWVFVNLTAMGVIFRNFPFYQLPVGNLLWVNTLALSLVVTVDSLHFALKVFNSVSKLHRLGNYDLFALLPAGELVNLVNICRTHRYNLDGTFRGAKHLFIIVIFAIGCTLSYWVSRGSTGFFVMLGLWIVLAGFMRCVDYVQSFVAATLITLLNSQHQNRDEARVRMIVSFLGLQTVFYVGLIPLLSTLPFFLQDKEIFPSRIDTVYLWWLTALMPLLFLICRELINLALWQAVQRRLEA